MKTIKHVWTVLCRNSVVDNESNNISLLDIMEKLDVGIEIKDSNSSKQPEKIVIPLTFEIVTMWARTDFDDKKERTVEAKTEIFDPNKKKIGGIINSFVLAPQFRRMRGRGKISNLGLTISGKYLFKISGKESGEKEFTEVAEIPLEVEITKKSNPKVSPN